MTAPVISPASPPAADAPLAPAADAPSDDRGRVLIMRPDGGANCSSVGSVVDLLFAAGAIGGALLVAITAALDDLEPPASQPPPDPTPAASPDAPTD